MLDFDETVSRPGSRALRGRVGCDPIGMIRFDLLEFVQQFVEFQVADDRRIQNVITMIVGVDLLFEFFVTGFCGHALIIAKSLDWLILRIERSNFCAAILHRSCVPIAAATYDLCNTDD